MRISTEKMVIGGMVALLAGVVVAMTLQSSPTYNKDLAATEAGQAKFGACLKDAGLKFYGASWCPHCERMRKLLGDKGYKPIYTECATPDGGQTQVCKDAKIEGYPTWVLKDGTATTGERTLKQIGDLAGCSVPAEYGLPSTISPEAAPVITPAPGKNGSPKVIQEGGASSAK